MVQDTLKIVWKREISTGLNCPWKKLFIGRLKKKIMAPNSTAPVTLKSKWITAALFAVLEVPVEEIIAVTQVPMFCPKVM